VFLFQKETREFPTTTSVVWFDSNKQKNSRRKRRIALYSHDTMGLGHFRRNLLIAQTLADSLLDLEILIITGSPAARSFSGPPNWDCLVLPSVRKDINGEYVSHFADITAPYALHSGNFFPTFLLLIKYREAHWENLTRPWNF
jgi:hypothetical protein